MLNEKFGLRPAKLHEVRSRFLAENGKCFFVFNVDLGGVLYMELL